MELWKQWLDALQFRKSEVYNTLKKEGITLETIFLDEKLHLTYYLLESDDIKKSIEIFNNSTACIDLEHKKVVDECLEFIECKKSFVHFEVKNNFSENP